MKHKSMWLGVGMLGAALLLAGCGSDQQLEQTKQQLTDATNSPRGGADGSRHGQNANAGQSG